MRPVSLYRLATLGAIFLVLGNAWLANHSLRNLFSAERWQAHTLEVITANEETFLQISTASSAARGFLLTGDPLFLVRFNDAVQATHADLAKLTSLTSDNVSQRHRIVILRARTDSRFQVLDAVLVLKRAHPEAPVPSLQLRAALVDTPADGITIGYALGEIRGEEERLLRERTTASRRARQGVVFSFAGATLLDVALLLLGGRLLLHSAERRQELASRATEIVALNAELTAVNGDLERRVEKRTSELNASNQELEAFSYSVSHDLRAPLRTIDGFSLALEEDFADILNEEGRDYIRRVRGGVQRMGVLIDSLLQLSRVTRSELTRETVNLSQLAKGVILELEASDPDRHVVWTVPGSLPVQADSRLLRIALENLIGNAWKFTSRTPEARIELGSFEREGQAVYFIRDNGAGFDMKYVDRLFTAFQRLHGDRDFKGSGIGLATVSRIIRRHHGEIWAESETGSGATFFFTLATPASVPLTETSNATHATL